MKRVFGAKKDKEPPPSVQDASDRINKRGENVDQKIRSLDAELSRYKEQIKKMRPGPAQEAIKARAMRVLKQKRIWLLEYLVANTDLNVLTNGGMLIGSLSLSKGMWYEGQRDMLYNQTFNLDQVAFASEGIKDAQQTKLLKSLRCYVKHACVRASYIYCEMFVCLVSAQRGTVQGSPGRALYMTALKSANKELKGMMKTVKIQDIDNLQDEMMDLMDVSHEIQETLGRSYNVPDDIDEDELMGELDALEADMGMEDEAGVPSYLQPDKEPDLDAELNLPTAPSGHASAQHDRPQAEDELGLPSVPQASIRG
ncbi:vacuolar protein sorting-associated protein 60.2 [Citrus sinensis]|uniref:Vacuolar protein sorting-associated protein 60.2 n=1 Tax=Citrus sinensis TaxID=2711 RepID=A0ACB8L727_CITSI|nr:vacuolar protein sorting-associated protein 60.2 [Citrus sinensis]